jgi:hypothetical protein
VATGRGEGVRASTGAIAVGVGVLETELTAGLGETVPFPGAQAARETASRIRPGKRRTLFICLLGNVVYISFLTQISYQMINGPIRKFECLLFDWKKILRYTRFVSQLTDFAVEGYSTVKQ